ncbi:hypothetical protein R83H12_02489 [Fibrobacteria bacterium R8-3-H12]
MKNSCKAVLLVFLFALLANAQEAPPPLSNEPVPDSSLATIPNDSLAVAKESSSSIAQVQKSSSSIAIACEQKKADYQKNLRVAAYLHPLSLFYGAAYNMLMFASTIEKPLNLSKSVIIQPTIWLGSSDGYIHDVVEYEKLIKLGTGIGIRQYATDKGSGFYLQAIASAYYTSAESLQYKEENYWDGYKIKSWTKVKCVLGELMLYIGRAHKWQNISFFYEGGLGLGYDGTDTFKIGYINKLASNFNLGMGVPF